MFEHSTSAGGNCVNVLHYVKMRADGSVWSVRINDLMNLNEKCFLIP